MGGGKIEELSLVVPGGKIYGKKWTPGIITYDVPVILLHDSLGSVGLWRNFPQMLSESLSRCVVAYDRLGFGKSDSRDTLPSKDFVEEEGTKYFPVIKSSLSIKKYVLLGHSVGGGMAINIASRDSDCTAVITMSAQAYIEDLTLRGIRKAKESFELPGQIERLEKYHGSNASWVLHAWTGTWLSPEFENWSLKSCIDNVSCPVLAIHGKNDEYGSIAFPEFITRNTSGKAEMLLLEDCGHLPHKDRTEDVIGAVTKFVNGNV